MRRLTILMIVLLILILSACDSGLNINIDSSERGEEDKELKVQGNIIMMIDEAYYDYDYIEMAIEQSIKDNLTENYSFKLLKIKTDDRGGYVIPKNEVEIWLDENEGENNSVIVFGLEAYDNVHALIEMVKGKACIVRSGNVYLNDLPVVCNYNIYVDYSAAAKQQGNLIAQCIDREGGDILITAMSQNSIDQNELTEYQQTMINEILLNTEFDDRITFTYGNSYLEYGDVSFNAEITGEELNRAMANEYLSDDKKVLSIVGTSDNSCNLWIEAIEINKFNYEPLIFGTMSDADAFELLSEEHNIVLISNPYCYYEEVRVSLKCAMEWMKVGTYPQEEYVPVELLFLTNKNYDEHYIEYSHIYIKE